MRRRPVATREVETEADFNGTRNPEGLSEHQEAIEVISPGGRGAILPAFYGDAFPGETFHL